MNTDEGGLTTFELFKDADLKPMKPEPDDIRLQNLKPAWQPGQSGNPAGRKKGSKNLSTILDEVVSQERWERILDRLAQQAEAGDVPSLKLIIERKDGQARQHIQVSEVPKIVIEDAHYESHQDIQIQPGQQQKDLPEPGGHQK